MKIKKISLVMLLFIILLSNVCFATDVIDSNNITTNNELINDVGLQDINYSITTTNFILICIFLFMFLSGILRFRK